MQNSEKEDKVTILYGYLILEKEFNWVSRKTIKGWLTNKYKYFAHSPYVRCGPFDTYDEAMFYKIGFDR